VRFQFYLTRIPGRALTLAVGRYTMMPTTERLAACTKGPVLLKIVCLFEVRSFIQPTAFSGGISEDPTLLRVALQIRNILSISYCFIYWGLNLLIEKCIRL